jgi:regulator of protease activity HflC (stomatin/prohibitin superfamily)
MLPDSNIIISTLEWVIEKWVDHLSPIVILRCYEGGVLLRLGSYQGELKEGVNFKMPFIDEVHSVIKTVDTFHVAAVDITTLDGKQASVEPIIKFDIIDFKKYLIDTNQASDNLHDIARGIIADHLTDCNWEDIKDKKTLTQIKNKLKSECDDMGVNILKVYFGRIVTTKMFTVFKE